MGIPTNDKIEELTYLSLEAKAFWNSRHFYNGLWTRAWTIRQTDTLTFSTLEWDGVKGKGKCKKDEGTSFARAFKCSNFSVLEGSEICPKWYHYWIRHRTFWNLLPIVWIFYLITLNALVSLEASITKQDIYDGILAIVKQHRSRAIVALSIL